METRRIVTGVNEQGRSVLVSDEVVPGVELMPDYFISQIWGSDTTPVAPNDGSTPDVFGDFFAPAGGYRVVISVKPPGDVAPVIDEEVGAGFESKMPGWAKFFEDQDPGMHATDSVDVVIVLSGEEWCELDDGREVHLRAGDIFIQNGTRHRWHNRGTVPCVTAVVLLGAQRG